MSLHFGTASVPAAQAAVPYSCSTPTGVKLPQAKNVWCLCMLGHFVISNSVTLWTVAYQVSLSVGYSRQEYWSGLPYPFKALYFLCPSLQLP